MVLGLMSKKQVILVLKILFRSSFYMIWIWLLATAFIAQAQDDELIGGVQIHEDASTDGHVLFSTHMLPQTYLIDKNGQIINTWNRPFTPSSALYLSDEGNLIRAGRSGGRETDAIRVIEEVGWDGNLIWQYILEAPRFIQHHDIQPMPNGNILVLMKELVPIDEALELGFDPDVLEKNPNPSTAEPLTEIELDSIFEINPQTDAVVWEWHVRDHLIQDINPDLPNFGDIADFPRRINLNYNDVPRVGDIIHMNSIAYNADSDLIIVSVRSFSEVWVIDHSPSTEEAQGIDGDLYYRWGNPASYDHGTENDRVLYYQHDARWLGDSQADSNLTVFNNGSQQEKQSQVIEFAFPTEWMTDNTFNSPEIIWESTSDFFANNMSGGQFLANGNVFITLAPDGRFIEITPDDDIVWEYINPIYRMTDESATNRVFRATFYPADFVGFEGKDMQPQGELPITPIRR
jgi:hypothetical protein